MQVSVTSSLEDVSDWKVEIVVPAITKIKELKVLLSKHPHNLQVSPDQRVLQRSSNGKVLTTVRDTEKVRSELVLLNFKPVQKTATNGSKTPASQAGMKDMQWRGMADAFAQAVHGGLLTGDGGFTIVTVTTTTDRYEHWNIEVRALSSTTVMGFKEVLMRAPWNLEIDRTQKVLRRMTGKNAGFLQSMSDNELIIPEMVLLNYVPEGVLPRPEAGKAKNEPKAAAKAEVKGPTKEQIAERKRGEKEFERRRQIHAGQTPGERRAYSWPRTASFCSAIFEITGTARNWWERVQEEAKSDNPPPEKPFVMWILGATNEIEGWLVENGYFSNANFTDTRPTECIVMGHGLRRVVHGAVKLPFQLNGPNGAEATSAHAETVSYEDEAAIASLPKPDIVVMLCVEFGSSSAEVPEHVVKAAGQVHCAITTRFRIWNLSNDLSRKLSFAPLRSPLSALAGDKNAEFDDNGWIIGAPDVQTMVYVLKQDLRPSMPESKAPEEKVMAMFWGIIDLKYDNRLPLLERVKVLETGDGRSSKFSNDGAEIPKRFRAKYRMEEFAGAGKHTVVANNKKLTHDEFDLMGYKHIVPDQLCLPRVYDVGLAQRIIADLKCNESDTVVLKLCNRSRGAGIIPVPVCELDEVLEELLEVPDASGLETWLNQKLERLNQETIEVKWGEFEEQYRHWWSNECPFFCVERCCYSIPMPKDPTFGGEQGKLYDGTLRVAFALRRKPKPVPKAQPTPNLGANHLKFRHNPEPEVKDELEIEWLGGYWKLPKDDVHSPHLRDRIVSAAKSGTAPIPSHQLYEIYAAMGDSVQQLFSASEPTSSSLAERYGDRPELAAYLTARLSVTLKELSRCRKVMGLAESVLEKAPDGLCKRLTHSYVHRGYGVFDAMQPPGLWEQASERYRQSIDYHPANATASYLLGMSLLELGKPEEAMDCFHRSLLLDLDFKAPYVNLGVVYIRLRKWEKAIEISEALLKRHPDSPQCRYHIGIACYFMSVALEDKASIGYPLSNEEATTYEELRKRASQEILDSRNSDDGQRLENRFPSLPPWTEEDDRIVVLLRPNYSILLKNRRQDIKAVNLPKNAGWRFFGWRT